MLLLWLLWGLGGMTDLGQSERRASFDPDKRYAEGQREAAVCPHCGSPVWVVYHGPNRNHTWEPRKPDGSLPGYVGFDNRRTAMAVRAVMTQLDAGVNGRLPLQRVCCWLARRDGRCRRAPSAFAWPERCPMLRFVSWLSSGWAIGRVNVGWLRSWLYRLRSRWHYTGSQAFWR